MMDCVRLQDGGASFRLTIPARMIEASGLLYKETPDATIQESELAVDDPMVLLELDESEGMLTAQLPEPPEDPPEPEAAEPTLTDVERKVLEQADSQAD
ncbi:hypothetical protein D3D02_17845 [Halobellus sp. Atlit-38R]|uniref:hypothetical protein n=1 Tax=Halobellus sp. Atlit-38R TaxID=2282131 RepID=UPI000EF2017F|nr:hypothetical protein [Halobellus sp. Atlit-38R]RLM83521.1 hypothetical protein D3D02_17845 [Halobellus sp. Atlit-38R]